MSEMRLHDPSGNRLYLNAEERTAFLAAARRQPARDRTLCEALHWTGCRPSELLEITPARVGTFIETFWKFPTRQGKRPDSADAKAGTRRWLTTATPRTRARCQTRSSAE